MHLWFLVLSFYLFRDWGSIVYNLQAALVDKITSLQQDKTALDLERVIFVSYIVPSSTKCFNRNFFSAFLRVAVHNYLFY